MKKNVLILALAVSFLTPVMGFPAQFEVVDRTAVIGDPAELNVTVQNQGQETERFRISSILSPPATSGWFDYDYSKEVPPGENRSFLVTVEPDENAIQQNYGFELNVRSLFGGELEKFDSYITVENRYDLSITSFRISETELEPGESLNVTATVRNTHSNTLEDFRVRLSGMNQQDTKTGTVLGAGDSIRYSFNLEVPGMAEPGNRTINLSVIDRDEQRHYVSRQVSIQPVNDITRETSGEDRLISRTRTFTVVNSGNVKESVSVNASLPTYMAPLASFSSDPSSTDLGASEQFYTWQLEVPPGEQRQVSYQVDYTPALAFLALIFLGILGFRKLQTDLKISKQAVTKDGAVKINIEIENNSGTPMTDLEVKDFVPDIAEVSQDFEFARPVQTKTSNGTKLRWEIDRLEPGEQRVFEYRIKPLIEVEDGAMLPALTVEREGVKIKEGSDVEAEFQSQ